MHGPLTSSWVPFSAPFFESCINEQDLDEMNIEIIRNTLYKSYLESFYNFCKNIGGETEEVMCEILAVSQSITLGPKALFLQNRQLCA